MHFFRLETTLRRCWSRTGPLMAKFADKDLVDSLRNELASEQAQKRWIRFLQAVALGAMEFERYQQQEEDVYAVNEFEDYENYEFE